jgi:hypothetical protein
MKKKVDLVGKKFGKVTVLTLHHRALMGSYYWKYICDCGESGITTTNNLQKGTIPICKCIDTNVINNDKRGEAKSTYNIWSCMKHRCLMPTHASYAYYGGRGITIDKRWLSFNNFLEDMGPRPSKLTLERKDNNKGYSKDNCIWASNHTQARNKRNNVNITYNGLTMCLKDWAVIFNTSSTTIQNRLHKGLSFREALGLPEEVE